jgi:putative membrane protein
MPRILVTWVVNCVGLFIAAAVIGPISYGHKFGTLILAGAVLALVNLALRPLVIILTLPAVILTLGLAMLFINALMLWVTSKIVTGLHVGGFWSTVGGALILWIVNMALRPWVYDRGDRDRRGGGRRGRGGRGGPGADDGGDGRRPRRVEIRVFR